MASLASPTLLSLPQHSLEKHLLQWIGETLATCLQEQGAERAPVQHLHTRRDSTYSLARAQLGQWPAVPLSTQCRDVIIIASTDLLQVCSAGPEKRGGG